MDWERIEQGTARTAAQLRIQLAQMTAASQLLERCAWDEKSKGYLAALNQGICRMLRIVGRMELWAGWSCAPSWRGLPARSRWILPPSPGIWGSGWRVCWTGRGWS